MTGKCGYG